MNIEVLEPLGARVTGVSLSAVDPGVAGDLRDVLAEHGVIVLPEQAGGDAEFIAFLRAFGELAFTEGETPAPGVPELNLVSNVGRAEPQRSTFHVDTSYVRVPPAYTALRAVQVPASGGATLFTNQYRAYETLPPDVRATLQGRTLRHVVTGLELDDGAEAAAEHPVFRPHPRTGRIALYLTTRKRCAAISGMDDAETASMVEFLLEHSTRPENTLRHAWSPGDVVMWDNACVLHRADHSGVVGDRTMHRGMVAG